VLSYFLKSREKSDQVIVLRGLLVLDGVKKKVSARSVSDIWPESSLWEREAAELFGIEFSGKDGLRYQENHLLPPGWQGFPLRKGYEFPTEYLGITHSRPIETSE
jgi:NADH:ubiquinone oxidoreductase subunit C